MAGKKCRFWSEEEKRLICEQTRAPGVSVAQVALRYALNTNMIFKWLREPRFAQEVAEGEGKAGDIFLPVEVPELGISATCDADLAGSCISKVGGQVISASVIDITFSDGRRILVDDNTELDTVIGLVKELMA